jgi:hypothetical protein
VCERCGAFNEVPDAPCWRCGGTTSATGDVPSPRPTAE